MKRPLNYEILKYFTKVDKASANDVYEALKNDYKSYKSFKIHSISESLMTAKENGLIDEVGYELKGNDLIIYYKASNEQKDTINSYIK